jgi:hypothetical protein
MEDREPTSLGRRKSLKIAGVTGVAIGATGGLGGLLAACGRGATTTTWQGPRGPLP